MRGKSLPKYAYEIRDFGGICAIQNQKQLHVTRSAEMTYSQKSYFWFFSIFLTQFFWRTQYGMNSLFSAKLVRIKVFATVKKKSKKKGGPEFQCHLFGFTTFSAKREISRQRNYVYLKYIYPATIKKLKPTDIFAKKVTFDFFSIF